MTRNTPCDEGDGCRVERIEGPDHLIQELEEWAQGRLETVDLTRQERDALQGAVESDPLPSRGEMPPALRCALAKLLGGDSTPEDWEPPADD